MKTSDATIITCFLISPIKFSFYEKKSIPYHQGNKVEKIYSTPVSYPILYTSTKHSRIFTTKPKSRKTNTTVCKAFLYIRKLSKNKNTLATYPENIYLHHKINNIAYEIQQKQDLQKHYLQTIRKYNIEQNKY